MGSIEYTVSGGSFTRLLMRLSSEQLPFTELCENGKDLHICVPLGQCRRFLHICEEVGLEVKFIKRRGAVRLLEFIRH
ncbi:MAG: sporulation protein YqfD, partial [Ruminococcus sp.]|nr:sporulation protein YqfD [Ruminococcus sp.]